jgi:P4 family phage/plasmid primase-like protien
MPDLPRDETESTETPTTNENDNITTSTSTTKPPSPTPGHLRERIVALAEREFYFALGPDDSLYIYNSGRYVLDAARREHKLAHWLRRQLQSAGCLSAWTETWERSTLALLARDKPYLWPAPPPGRINLLNGVLDVATLTLEPHTPKWLSTVQIPISYIPGAKADDWPRFLATVFPADSFDFAWELIGGCMTPLTSVQSGAWLLGTGRNGKSTFLDALDLFIGHDNVCNTTIQSMDSNQFSAAKLQNKLLCIDSDADPESWRSTVTFKKAVTGDWIEVQRKYRDPFQFQPHCKFAVAANTLPHSADTTEGFLRRWSIVPFTRNFDLQANQREDRATILARLAQPTALSSALNYAVAGLQRLMRNGQYSTSPAMDAARAEYRRLEDPLFMFADYVLATVECEITADTSLNDRERDQQRGEGRFVSRERMHELQLAWLMEHPQPQKPRPYQHLEDWFRTNKPLVFSTHRPKAQAAEGRPRGFLVRPRLNVQ